MAWTYDITAPAVGDKITAATFAASVVTKATFDYIDGGTP